MQGPIRMAGPVLTARFSAACRICAASGTMASAAQMNRIASPGRMHYERAAAIGMKMRSLFSTAHNFVADIRNTAEEPGSAQSLRLHR
jgi:hypothetical protein